MKRCYDLAVPAVLAVLLLLTLTSSTPANPVPMFSWYDDVESGINGWMTSDLTATAVPHFHWDTYLAYEGHSWWCGNFDYDSDGGYGNGWDDRLDLPPVQVTPVAVEEVSWGELKSFYREGPRPEREDAGRDAIFPVLTFVYRHDSEIGYDFTYVQAESNGVYVDLNRGYDGVQEWSDLGPYGFDLAGYDDPLRVRFRFTSDGAWSDEDGDYLSVGGAFHVDNVKIYDFMTGDVLFYDSEPGGDEGECTPAIPGAAGDYWHIIDRACPALSDPHSWWCGDDADTSFVPPNLADALFTPVIYTNTILTCTLYAAIHFAIPTVDNDYFAIWCTFDGADYYAHSSWWGDFEQCYGWGSSGINGFSFSEFVSGYPDHAGAAFVMYTTDNGCGPAVGGGAGVMIDDVWICTNGAQPDWSRNEDLILRSEQRRSAGKSAGLGRRLLRR
jgi:hypothetical protein